MSTKAGIIYQMMHHYLNPQTGMRVVPNKPDTPEIPAIGKVELRKQAKEDAEFAPFRLSGIWPKPHGVVEWEGRIRQLWVYPDGVTAEFTPPEDYPEPAHTGESLPVHPGFAEAFAEKAAFIAGGGKVERVVVVDNTTRDSETS